MSSTNENAGEISKSKDIEEKVISIIADKLGKGKEEITLESHFVNDLNADSLDTVEIIMELEKGFSLTIPDDEAEKISTIQDAVTYIQDKDIA